MLVEFDELLCFVDGLFGIEGQAGINFGGNSAWNQIDNLFADAYS